MRIAYLDCASGISGDMTLGALVDAGADLAAVQSAIDSLGLPSCRLVRNEVKKRGFRATQIVVEHEPEHQHRHLHHITAMIDDSILTTSQRELAKRIFQKLAEAEAKVHGSTVEKVHFHEVGAVDSIADIVGTAVAFDLLGIERVECSPVPTGRGFVNIAHGRCSIPAPATGELLRGIPLAPLEVEGELTTPTGAAIVAALAERFGHVAPMVVEQIGYGAGQKDFEHPNLLRVLIGSATPESRQHDLPGNTSSDTRPRTESIVVLETNLDDSTGEGIAHAIDRIWETGALDIALTPIQMKKGRPGILLTVQCRPENVDTLEQVLFGETTTLGIRRSILSRVVLARERHEVETRWGTIAGKVAYLPSGEERFSPEYEACRDIAAKHRVALTTVIDGAKQSFTPASSK